MGLDLIEIVMEAEEEFGVSLSHDCVPATPGELLEAVVSALREQHPARFEPRASYSDGVWAQLQSMIVTQLGVAPASVTKSANFVTDLGCV